MPAATASAMAALNDADPAPEVDSGRINGSLDGEADADGLGDGDGSATGR